MKILFLKVPINDENGLYFYTSFSITTSTGMVTCRYNFDLTLNGMEYNCILNNKDRLYNKGDMWIHTWPVTKERRSNTHTFSDMSNINDLGN
jgi:hypothetical protein